MNYDRCLQHCKRMVQGKASQQKDGFYIIGKLDADDEEEKGKTSSSGKIESISPADQTVEQTKYQLKERKR